MKKLRLFFYIILLVIIVVLAVFYFVPLGKMTYRHDFSKEYYNILGGKGFFYKFGPVERLIDDNKIIGDPVYFYLRTPRTFSSAKLKIKYQFSPQLLSEKKYFNIEAGVLMDKSNWHYDLKPVFNSTLNDISNNKEFYVSRDNDIIFAQSKSAEKFVDYKEFLNSDKYPEALFYNYYPFFDFRINNYLSVDGMDRPDYFHHDISTNLRNLRGSYLFYTYIKDDKLKFDFEFSAKDSLEASIRPKNVSIFVYYQNETIFSDSFQFNSNEKHDYFLNLEALPEGAYKIEIKTEDDVITRNLKTELNKISFLNRVWLDDLDDSFTLYSNKNSFRVKSFNSDCLGELKINGQVFQVDKIFQQFNFSGPKNNLDNNLNKIESDSCGFLIETNGFLSFSETSFMNPLLNRLDQDSDLEQFDYLLAKYKNEYLEEGVYLSELDFNLIGAFRDKDGYRFLISAPFLSELEKEKYLEILDLEIELQGRTLKEKIFSIFKINKDDNEK